MDSSRNFVGVTMIACVSVGVVLTCFRETNAHAHYGGPASGGIVLFRIHTRICVD